MFVRSRRHSFCIKVVAALVLVAVVDGLWADLRFGSWLGGFALLWCALLVATRPALRRGFARLTIVAAACFAVVLVDEPQVLACILFWGALSMSALLPRVAGFDDAWRWLCRLWLHALTGPFAPATDLWHVVRPRARATVSPMHVAKMLVVPIAGTILFVWLFAEANPLIEQAFANIDFPSIREVAFWLCACTVVWPSLRPRAFVTRHVPTGPTIAIRPERLPVTSIVISLAAFNAVFAVQNSLDLTFLWSGSALPAGVTLAEYAHRGAYPLIVTALLAGLFVVTTLRPGSPSAANRTVRRLVVAWIAQNVLLVASSILRTCNYVAAYMLTPMRIAALAWMAAVALGLVLICWRLLANRSTRWLINANALAAIVLVSSMTIVDLDAISADWNVAHAREAGGLGAPLDLCQLDQMGAPALIPLIELERRLPETRFRDRVHAVRDHILHGDEWTLSLEARQADWRTWSWRDARRLARADASFGVHAALPETVPRGPRRNCDGSLPRATPSGDPLQPDP